VLQHFHAEDMGEVPPGQCLQAIGIVDQTGAAGTGVELRRYRTEGLEADQPVMRHAAVPEQTQEKAIAASVIEHRNRGRWVDQPEHGVVPVALDQTFQRVKGSVCKFRV
jgi:hypothetical protein